MRTLTCQAPVTIPASTEPRGYVHASGEFVFAQRAMVEGILRREETRAHQTSPAARILAWDDDGRGGLLLSTSTEHLAHRLGRTLNRELGGELHHGFSSGNKLAFVWWRL